MEFIDIHNHVAWEIDDGMPSEEDAVKTLEIAKVDGIRTIVSTPHIMPGYTKEPDFEMINKRIDELKILGDSKGVKILRGGEFLMNDLAMEWIRKGIFNKIEGTEYILAEFNPRRDINSISFAEDILYELTVKNMIPIVAHAERYFHEKLDLDRIREWINMGCFIQVNRTSILGIHGKKVQQNAIDILEAGLCHVVATDTHRAEGGRICKLSDAYEKVADLYGDYNADLLFYENPMHVINNEVPDNMKTVQKKKIGFLKRLRGL